MSIGEYARRCITRVVTSLAMFLAVMFLASCDGDGGSPQISEPLKIGYLADFSGPLKEFGSRIQEGVELAIDHINEGGGVNGHDVVLLVGDTALQREQAVAEAKRLIEVEGVAAIVGPLASSSALAIVEVAVEAKVPFISPSATSPGISDVNDSDYLFRAPLSDAAQGKVLADLVTEDGVNNVGILYLDDAYGRGLLEHFKKAYAGTVAEVPHDAKPEGSSYLNELRQAQRHGAQYLIAMGHAGQAVDYVPEAIHEGIFTQFYFVDGTRSEDLINAAGADNLEGFKGTVLSGDDMSLSHELFQEAFMARHDRVPTLPFVREAYDATAALALAAEKAGSVDGTAIRDALRSIASPDGETIRPGIAHLSRGLDLVRGDMDINYEGAASSLDWNADGDVVSGFVSIWAYQNGEIVELETVPVDLSQDE